MVALREKESFYREHQTEIDFHVSKLLGAVFPGQGYLYVMKYFESKKFCERRDSYLANIEENLLSAVMEKFNERAEDRCSEDEYEDLCLDWYQREAMGVDSRSEEQKEIELERLFGCGTRSFEKVLGMMGDLDLEN